VPRSGPLHEQLDWAPNHQQQQQHHQQQQSHPAIIGLASLLGAGPGAALGMTPPHHQQQQLQPQLRAQISTPNLSAADPGPAAGPSQGPHGASSGGSGGGGNWHSVLPRVKEASSLPGSPRTRVTHYVLSYQQAQEQPQQRQQHQAQEQLLVSGGAGGSPFAPRSGRVDSLAGVTRGRSVAGVGRWERGGQAPPGSPLQQQQLQQPHAHSNDPAGSPGQGAAYSSWDLPPAPDPHDGTLLHIQVRLSQTGLGWVTGGPGPRT
jgi:hypothetical protein